MGGTAVGLIPDAGPFIPTGGPRRPFLSCWLGRKVGSSMANENEKPLRAVGYCRTSGEGQRDNTSIDSQHTAINEQCQREDWQRARFYVDECKSGSKIAGRDEFQRMMRDAANGLFNVVVVYDIDRFSRERFDIMGRPGH